LGDWKKKQMDPLIKHQAGVYVFTHKESLQQYLGSAVDLSLRLEQYLQQFNMNNQLF
jgi:excinuclease UvrABC nuclease subunit